MSIEGQGHFFTIYFPGFVCFVLYWAKISGERLQDHWSSGFNFQSRFFIYFNFIANCQRELSNVKSAIYIFKKKSVFVNSPNIGN